MDMVGYVCRRGRLRKSSAVRVMFAGEDGWVMAECCEVCLQESVPDDEVINILTILVIPAGECTR